MVRTAAQLCLDLLREKGYKITHQRKIIIEEALKPCNICAQSKEIYFQVRKKDPSIGIATVYRTLLIMNNENIKEMLYHNAFVPNDKDKICIQNVCPSCGKITVIDVKEAEDGMKVVLEKAKLDYLSCRIHMVSVCDLCKTNEKNKAC